MKKKTIIVTLSMLSVLFIAIALLCMVFIVKPYFTYINTHTWATVTASVELASDAEDEFELTQEYLQGDTIIVGEVCVVITDIGSEGTVELKVKSGNLYDEAGNAVGKFTIGLDRPASFSMDGDTVTFEVISNRYE